MKSETTETMQPNTTQIKKIDLNILGINHFYGLYLKEKRKYTPSLFCIDKPNHLKRPRAATLKEFKTVIYEYFRIYFFELYMSKSAMYFPLAGLMKVVTYLPWVRKQSRSNLKEKVLCSSSGALGLFWYMRPGIKCHYMVDLKKLSGSTNMITKIETIFKQNHNKDLLPIFTEERKKGKTNKTLYRCIQKQYLFKT